MAEEHTEEAHHESFADTFGPDLWKFAVIFLGLIIFVFIVEFFLECITKVLLVKLPHSDGFKICHSLLSILVLKK